MKKTPNTQLLNSVCAPRQSTPRNRIGNSGRLLVALVCASLASLAASPAVRAAEPDGTYTMVSASGSLQAAGQVVEVSPLIAESFSLGQNGNAPTFTIRDGRLKINRDGAVNLIVGLGERFGGRFDIDKVSGPNQIVFRKAGKSYVGSTGRPIVVKFSSPLQTSTGTLKSVVRAKVKGSKLAITIPLSGSAMGHPISGSVTLVAKK